MSAFGRITINRDGDVEHVDANSSPMRFRFTGNEELNNGMTAGVQIEYGRRPCCKPCCKPFCCPQYFGAGFLGMDEMVKFENPRGVPNIVGFVVGNSDIGDPFTFLKISGDPSDGDDSDIDLEELIKSVYPDPTEFLQETESDELQLIRTFGVGYIGYGDHDVSVYGGSSVHVWSDSYVDTNSTHFGSDLMFNGYSLVPATQ